MVGAFQHYSLDPQNGARTADSAEFERVLGHSLTPLSVAIKELLNH